MMICYLSNDSSLPLLHLLPLPSGEPGQVLRLVLILHNLLTIIIMIYITIRVGHAVAPCGICAYPTYMRMMRIGRCILMV